MQGRVRGGPAALVGVACVAVLLGLFGPGCKGTIEGATPGSPGAPGSGPGEGARPGDRDGDGVPDAIDPNPDTSGDGTGGTGGSGADTDGDGVPDDEEEDAPGEGAADEEPAPSTRVYRLTHAQWERTVRELLQLPDSQELPGPLRDDPVQSGFAFDNNAEVLVVDEALFSGYERASSELAALVTGDATLFGNIAPDDSLALDERADTFIREFGQRAHRRPLSDEMVDEYRDLFDLAPTLYTGLPDFEAGARAVLEAMLLSPYFLYRIEESSDEVDGVIPLDAWEIASRLSYALWGNMPDGELFDAAASDALLETDEVETQARRMLADARAREVVLDFHRQMFDVARFAGINPAEAFFPDAPDTLADSALSEFERFVVDQVLERGNGYADMLLSTDSFANQDLADIYGLSGSFDDELVPVQLDPAERRGILTQVGFLAAHATSADPDPIHRGVFVARRISCTHIAAPPANVPPLPAPEPGATNRETIEAHTEDPDTVCATCHATLINPFGFPFEGFDAVGAVRTEDNGQSIDTTASPLIDGEATAVTGALDLVQQLAESEDVHACYLQHLLEYSLGREREKVDDALIDRLALQSVDDGASVEDLIVGLVKSRTFLTRSVEELPE